MVLASFLAVLGLGQGAVVISGGLDLSIPWTITFTGVLLTGITSAYPAASHGPSLSFWQLELLSARSNGIGIVVLGLPAIVMTLAMNGILQSSRARLQQWHPYRRGAVSLQWFMTGRLVGLAPSAWSLIIFAILATLLLSRTTFGRRLYAVGNSQRRLGCRVLASAGIVGVYALSGLCSAIVGSYARWVCDHGLAWYGRPVPAPIHCRRRSRGHSYFRRSGSLSRDPWWCSAADGYQYSLCGNDTSAGDARDNPRHHRTGRHYRFTREQVLNLAGTQFSANRRGNL